MTKSILVTGGAGYIGSHVCKALSAKGYKPVVYDNLSHGNEWAVKWGPFVQGDIHDAPGLSAVIEHYGPIAAIHLAGAIHAREASKNPGFYYYHNVEGSRTVFQTLLNNGISSVIFSSSAAIYGNPIRLPLDEEHPKMPLNAYGKSKWIVEEMLSDFEKAYGLRFIALRYFNVCGADSEGEIGEAHPNETHLIPLAIKAALGEQAPLSIFGSGTALRDYIHVSDIAESHVAALEHLLAERDSLRLNIGSEQGYTILQIVQEIEQLTGRKVPIVLRSQEEHESSALIADCTKAHSILAWKPRHSSLASIIQTAWKWHEQGCALCS